MKMLMYIINDHDVRDVTEAMMEGSFSVTKLSSTGGFLKAGMSTMLSIVASERVGQALEIIKTSTHSRKYDMSPSDVSKFSPVSEIGKSEIVVGGATVFVLNVEEQYKF